MSNETIFKALTGAGMTAPGACGLMGNMQAESAMRANNAQDGMTGCSDEEYTRRFNDRPEACYSDGVGYGLCQWTHPARKRNLRQFAKNWGVSVDAEDMQTEFAIHELRTEYAGLFQFLCGTEDVYKAAERICKEFERPAVNNVGERAGFAKAFYEALANICTSTESGTKPTESVAKPAESVAAPAPDDLKNKLTNETVMHLQSILVTYGYDLGTSRCSSGVDGLIGRKTVTALKDFAKRLEAIV